MFVVLAGGARLGHAAIFQEPEAVQEPMPVTQSAANGGSTEEPKVPALRNRVQRPVLLFAPDPDYSREALKKGISGVVQVSLTVDEKGRPRDVRVVQGVETGLDENALKAVRKYRFKPATREGEPVAFDMTVQVSFSASKSSG